MRSDAATRVALGFSSAGDTALLASGDTAFRAGLGSFLLGHAAWMRALHGRPGGGVVRRNTSRPLTYAPVLAAR